LVDDAHLKLGLQIPVTIVAHGEEIATAPGGGPSDGRMPCMVASEKEKSEFLSLKDGSSLDLGIFERNISADELNISKERYGPIVNYKNIEGISKFFSIASWYFSMAVRIFNNDGYHSAMAFLLKNGSPGKHLEMALQDRRDK